MASNAAIWQVQNSAVDGLEATAGSSNTVEFNETPIQTAGQVIQSSEFNIRDSIPENPRVFGDGNELQDMGLDGIDIQITGLLRDSDSGNTPMDKLMTWFRQDKQATGYTRGRFGLRLDDFPHFNIVPTSTFGGAIQSIRFVRDPENKNNVNFVLVMRISGDLTAWFLSNGF